MTPRDTSLGTGVYFALDDYIGFWRRVVIFTADFCLLAIALVACNVLYAIIGGLPGPFILAYCFGVWLYLAVLKPSKIRTIGYWMMNARIVNLRGDPPSCLRMTFRMLLWLLGPINGIVDIVWMGLDDDRQTLRDRFAGTCVIKNNAHPIGKAEIHLAHYNAFGLSLKFPRVMAVRKSNKK